MLYFYLMLQLVSIKIPGHSKLDSLEAKGNHLADTSTRNATLKGIGSSETPVRVQGDNSPASNLERLAREAQQLALEKKEEEEENHKIRNLKIASLIKEKGLVQTK